MIITTWGANILGWLVKASEARWEAETKQELLEFVCNPVTIDLMTK